jgi:ergothioneine biosynthesis protein EgtB
MRIASVTTSTENLSPLLEQAWKTTDLLFSCVERDAFGERPVELRYPLGFYVGHMPAFSSNMLLSDLLQRETEQPDLDQLFAFGIDPEDHEAAAHELRLPEIKTIEEYRDSVRGALREALEAILDHSGERPDQQGVHRLCLVLEHELMHHETLLYLLQELPYEHKRAAAFNRVTLGAAEGASEHVQIAGGPVRLGSELGEREYIWDNEQRAHTVEVEPFALGSLPVSIDDWREFMDAGGYAREELWSAGGWSWRSKHGIERPKDWSEGTDGVEVRTLFRTVPIESVGGWPVCVSWAEADAYARWRGGRLPTEAELSRAAYTAPDGSEREYPWGDELGPDGGFDFRVHSSLPIGSCPATDSAWGVSELVGNGWEWTSTAFGPYPGFEAYVRAYPGYSADFFDGQHYVVFGGSWATEERLLRRSYRNWYRYNYPFPFTKFRVAFNA